MNGVSNAANTEGGAVRRPPEQFTARCAGLVACWAG